MIIINQLKTKLILLKKKKNDQRLPYFHDRF